jgi:hypothetical protein
MRDGVWCVGERRVKGEEEEEETFLRKCLFSLLIMLFISMSLCYMLSLNCCMAGNKGRNMNACRLF